MCGVYRASFFVCNEEKEEKCDDDNDNIFTRSSLKVDHMQMENGMNAMRQHTAHC